jgi:predicted dehydrogenase
VRFDIGEVNLTEALEQGEKGFSGRESRRGGTPDYASLAWEFEGGAIGAFVLSHAPYLRRGLVPELELHGSEASIAVDRFHGRVTRSLPDNTVEVIEEAAPGGFDIGNRFRQWVIPALREVMSGRGQEEVDVPSLVDGWRVQLFTDAVLESSRRGAWVNLAEMAEGS